MSKETQIGQEPATNITEALHTLTHDCLTKAGLAEGQLDSVWEVEYLRRHSRSSVRVTIDLNQRSFVIDHPNYVGEHWEVLLGRHQFDIKDHDVIEVSEPLGSKAVDRRNPDMPRPLTESEREAVVEQLMMRSNDEHINVQLDFKIRTDSTTQS